MPALSVLIKPASSACNMQCTYCFYRDVAQNREQDFSGMLSLPLSEKLIADALDYAEGGCTFAFQGGEPTLAGLEYYKEFVNIVRLRQRPNIRVEYAIQTNALNLDSAWASFFAENHFLVGVSLDGPAEIHNRNRKDQVGKDTFNHIMKNIHLLQRYDVDFNILSVVTGASARSIEKIYRFFRKEGFRYLQFIPCLEPLNGDRGQADYHLSVTEYGRFLIRIFDLWYEDFKRGEAISIRHIDNWLSALMGLPTEACNMRGQCTVQFVVEGNGDVFPCDFYALDQWKLGAIGHNSFAAMRDSSTAKDFINPSLSLPNECQSCSVYPLCRNGCRRDRVELPNGTLGKNYYCEAIQLFFFSRQKELYSISHYLQERRL